MHNELLKLKIEAEIDDVIQNLNLLKEKCLKLNFWHNKSKIIKRCVLASDYLNNLQERTEAKLIVTIIGGTGIGKSTLFNALANSDQLSLVGNDRPTTRELVVCAADRHDGEIVLDKIGHANGRVVGTSSMAAFPNIILIDTPDTNSNENQDHHALLKQIIEFSDVLICGFSSENPKSWDNLAYMKQFIDYYTKDNLLVFLNQADRQDKSELLDKIKPDFIKHLNKAWQRNITDLYLLSAKNNLKHSNWPAGARPKHDLDDFAQFKKDVFKMASHEFVVSSRVKKAKLLYANICQFIEQEQLELAKVDDLETKVKQIIKEAEERALSAIKVTDSYTQKSTISTLYRRISSQWWGPIGFLVSIWAFFMSIGYWLRNIAKIKSPFTKIFNNGNKASSQDKSFAMYEYSGVFIKQWPAVAEELIDLGFKDTVRDLSTVMPQIADVQSQFDTRWLQVIEVQITKAAKRASGWWLQFILNGIPILLTFYIVIESIYQFLWSKHYLGAQYFAHALITLSLVSILCFIFLQIYIKSLSSTKLLKAAFQQLKEEYMAENNLQYSSPILQELRGIRLIDNQIKKNS